MSENTIFEHHDGHSCDLEILVTDKGVSVSIVDMEDCSKNIIALPAESIPAISEAFIRTLDQDQKKALFRKFGYIWDAYGWMGENQ